MSQEQQLKEQTGQEQVPQEKLSQEQESQEQSGQGQQRQEQQSQEQQGQGQLGLEQMSQYPLPQRAAARVPPPNSLPLYREIGQGTTMFHIPLPKTSFLCNPIIQEAQR